MKAGCATAIVLNKWDLHDGGEESLDHERGRVAAKLRLRPRVLTVSAKTGRHVARLLTEVIALGDRMSGRIPTPELNRFLAEAVQARQPPVGTRRGSSQHRLKLIYMAQIAERPPRFAIQVNSRTRVTRDYAYFLENRLRARYGMDGVPLIIDFVERGQRGHEGGVRRVKTAAAPVLDDDELVEDDQLFEAEGHAGEQDLAEQQVALTDDSTDGAPAAPGTR
jgi:GTP-binding protein